ncbi:hypothetical protein U9M48_013318 [Paspalum notatum var. saurae]|uniref:Uncharacterized protein n=1 Tax=Paspalum notatum var. saurae TaxID=547442 RepID=A0AAQ3SZ67_PASNO
MPRLGSATTTTMDRTTSPRVMLFGSASPLHGVNSFRHRIPSCHKQSVPLETQDTHREVRDCADEDDYGSTRERSVLLQVLEDETDDDHSYDGRR